MAEIDQFAVWDPELKRITFNLVTEIPTGLHLAAVTLDDGRLTTEYYLSVMVRDSENGDEREN